MLVRLNIIADELSCFSLVSGSSKCKTSKKTYYYNIYEIDILSSAIIFCLKGKDASRIYSIIDEIKTCILSGKWNLSILKSIYKIKTISFEIIIDNIIYDYNICLSDNSQVNEKLIMILKDEERLICEYTGNTIKYNSEMNIIYEWFKNCLYLTNKGFKIISDLKKQSIIITKNIKKVNQQFYDRDQIYFEELSEKYRLFSALDYKDSEYDTNVIKSYLSGRMSL